VRSLREGEEQVGEITRRLRLWRAFGRVVNTGLGRFLLDHDRKTVSRIAAAFSAPDLEAGVPWAPFRKPLTEAVVGLVTTAGFYLQGQEPFDVDASKGDASYRALPRDLNVAFLRIAHTHYPHERVERDVNVVFPVERLREVAEEGAIAALAPRLFSFGWSDLTKELIEPPDGTAHQVARALREDGVDAVILTPA